MQISKLDHIIIGIRYFFYCVFKLTHCREPYKGIKVGTSDLLLSNFLLLEFLEPPTRELPTTFHIRYCLHRHARLLRNGTQRKRRRLPQELLDLGTGEGRQGRAAGVRALG